ncbi:DUF6382 domain-containing protein [Paenibacillus wenxiniae]|uniref:DUF6382 domain-containing protein n=1 Tax=Paenibacillus wenxiniae TaxID=1636843 RepID=A0ABW4RI82_9BACL
MGSLLTQDFIQDGKTFMIIDREQSFASSEWSRTQTSMMLSSRIQGILQLHLHELNMKSQLRYDITGKRMLKHCLQSETIGIAEYVGLLLQLVSTLEESSQYMLSLPNYILDEDYMFMEGTLQAGRLYIAYVPVTEPLTDELVQEHIAYLASQWITAVRELHGNIVQQILRYCQDQSFTLAGLKQLLLHQLAGGTFATERQPNLFGASYVPRSDDRDWTYASGEEAILSAEQASRYHNGNAVQQSSSGQSSMDSHYQYPASADEMQYSSSRQKLGENGQSHAAFKPTQGIAGLSSASSLTVTPSTKPKLSLFNAKKKQPPSSHYPDYQDTGDIEEPKKLPSSYRTYLLAGSALLIAMIWRYGYVEHGNDLTLYGCVALTVAVVLTIYLVLKGKISIGPKNNAVAEPGHIHSVPSRTAAPIPSGRAGKDAQEEAESYGQEPLRWNPEAVYTEQEGHSPAYRMNGSATNVAAYSAPSQESIEQRERSIAELFGSFSYASSRNRSETANGMESSENGNGNRNGNEYLSDVNGVAEADRAYAAHAHRSGTPMAEQSVSTSGEFSKEARYFEKEASGYMNHAPTETLSSHMATVLLDEHDRSNQACKSENEWNGYLERRDREGGSKESIRLRRGSFIIGRAEDGVHYHEKSVGTSRNHVELEVRNGQMFIKDLGSRNGTQLKGESLVPYKSYPIQDGDSFTIARALYTLRLTS